MTFSRKRRRQNHRFHRPRRGNEGVFGGEILSQSQIEALNARIRAHEDAEFAKFEKEFDNHLNEL